MQKIHSDELQLVNQSHADELSMSLSLSLKEQSQKKNNNIKHPKYKISVHSPWNLQVRQEAAPLLLPKHKKSAHHFLW